MTKQKDTQEEVIERDIVKKDVVKFSKEQILASNRFKERRDAIGAILKDDKEYSIDEVERMYKKFMKEEVK